MYGLILFKTIRLAYRPIFPIDIYEFNECVFVWNQRLINNQGRFFMSDETLFALIELMYIWNPNWGSYNDSSSVLQ